MLLTMTSEEEIDVIARDSTICHPPHLIETPSDKFTVEAQIPSDVSENTCMSATSWCTVTQRENGLSDVQTSPIGM
jgi:hypothetical protein